MAESGERDSESGNINGSKVSMRMLVSGLERWLRRKEKRKLVGCGPIWGEKSLKS